MKYMVTYQEPRQDFKLDSSISDKDYYKIEVGLPWSGTVRGENRTGTITYVDHKSGEVTVSLQEEPATSCEQSHVFYILHPNGLSSWYLHANDLMDEIKMQLQLNGYVDVLDQQTVGIMGGYYNEKEKALGVHLHFELRENSNALMDPYGFMGSPALWKDAL